MNRAPRPSFARPVYNRELGARLQRTNQLLHLGTSQVLRGQLVCRCNHTVLTASVCLPSSLLDEQGSSSVLEDVTGSNAEPGSSLSQQGSIDQCDVYSPVNNITTQQDLDAETLAEAADYSNHPFLHTAPAASDSSSSSVTDNDSSAHTLPDLNTSLPSPATFAAEFWSHPNLSSFLPHVSLERFFPQSPSPATSPAFSSAQASQQQSPEAEASAADTAKLWALVMLSLAYVHQSTATFVVPALLPIISPELELTDFQGALLSAAPSYLYAFALVPLGLLADRTHRPSLLALSMSLWSLLTIRTASSTTFPDLLSTRLAFAGAQAAQNPISFSLIPELFPTRKSFAMALYNTAIYVGRALAFLSVFLMGAPATTQVSAEMIPLDRLNLQKVSILYSSGSMAAVTPIYDYNYSIIEYAPSVIDHTSPWRHLLQWLAIPGFVLGAAMLLTVQEPRSAAAPPVPWWQRGVLGQLFPVPQQGGMGGAATAGGVGGQLQVAAASGAAAAAAAAGGAALDGAVVGDVAVEQTGGVAQTLKKLMGNTEFQLVTLAAAVNDMGSYALIAWHSTFYERVYGLEPAQYAPLLAAVLPIGGILGGVGGGLAADYLETKGLRYWLTVGATLAAAPCIAQSLLSPTYEGSFAALLIGAALSEAWRAPAQVMARTVAPPESASTASAVYLCIRNLVGGLGPLAVAQLSGHVGLQQALLLVPACFAGSGVLFAASEVVMARHRSAEVQGGDESPAASDGEKLE